MRYLQTLNNPHLRRGIPQQRECGVCVRGKDDRVVLIRCAGFGAHDG